MNLLELLGYFNYWVFAIVLTVGLYTVIAKINLVKKLIGLSIFQSAVFLMYITMDKVEGGTAPIIQKGMENQVFSNPLPQVLILTAIVVGVSTLALGLAIVVRIFEAYGTIEEDEILDAD
ncbi:Na+/H+ antiporter subunit C [Mangrovimicrobium sediminis]|uniref:Na+/H+ antiporter subunit C n=1 Tax=Mangrovimicrobium sediminis TaxID=2562682 RepID=A0A4Z0LYH2_9GAMM|nr:cation:proton antiporter subunit C [Haliea sp. SAOS-164]TGD72226.1 Na+/H+ antiporter subunit C [Haliea sp. SAOS-164]